MQRAPSRKRSKEGLGGATVAEHFETLHVVQRVIEHVGNDVGEIVSAKELRRPVRALRGLVLRVTQGDLPVSSREHSGSAIVK